LLVIATHPCTLTRKNRAIMRYFYNKTNAYGLKHQFCLNSYLAKHRKYQKYIFLFLFLYFVIIYYMSQMDIAKVDIYFYSHMMLVCNKIWNVVSNDILKISTSHEALFHHSITSNLNKRNRDRHSLGVLVWCVCSIITPCYRNEHPEWNASKPEYQRKRTLI